MFEHLAEGFWQVGEKKFSRKFEALVYSSNNNLEEVKFKYFDEVWNSFDRTQLGKFSLNELYKQRAQQLRDEYDYLILYFSGGADSYNALRSFLDNDIKLDEVCVKWAMSAIKAKIYSPNPNDTSSWNTLSEWDYAIKPVLDWLSKIHPEVKITIVDWSENISGNTYHENLFKKVNNFTDVEVPFMMSYTNSERRLVEQGKKVASIYGIDKPHIAFKDNKWFMGFIDAATSMGTPSDINPTGTEYFYWSPKFPILAFQQAHTFCSYIEKNEELMKFFFNPEANNWSIHTKFLSNQVRNDMARSILYNNWTGAFQADKPIIADREDKHFWIFHHPELTNAKETFIDMNSLLLSQLDLSYVIPVLGNTSNKIRGIYRSYFSKWHFVKFKESISSD